MRFWPRGAKRTLHASHPPAARDPLPFRKRVTTYFITTASVVAGKPIFLQNAAKRGSCR